MVPEAPEDLARGSLDRLLRFCYLTSLLRASHGQVVHGEAAAAGQSATGKDLSFLSSR
jgi:hypothetical protein